MSLRHNNSTPADFTTPFNYTHIQKAKKRDSNKKGKLRFKAQNCAYTTQQNVSWINSCDVC